MLTLFLFSCRSNALEGGKNKKTGKGKGKGPVEGKETATPTPVKEDKDDKDRRERQHPSPLFNLPKMRKKPGEGLGEKQEDGPELEGNRLIVDLALKGENGDIEVFMLPVKSIG